MKTASTMKIGFALFGALISSLAAPQAAQAAPTWITCTPTQTVTYSSRVHVKCASAVSGISYFAAPTSNPDTAARIMSTINTGLVSGHTLTVLYDPADLSGSAIGCANSDCRLIQAIGVLK